MRRLGLVLAVLLVLCSGLSARAGLFGLGDLRALSDAILELDLPRAQKLAKSGAHIVLSEPRWPGFFELAKKELLALPIVFMTTVGIVASVESSAPTTLP